MSLKSKLVDGGTVILVNLGFNAGALVEYLGELGIDAVMIDCEHSSASVERVEELTRAARAGGIASIVRPEKLDEAILTRYLDCRPDGVIVPHVDDAETARRLVRIVRHARPLDYERLFLIAMIESLSALERLDEILEVDGIDAFFVARVDLAKSMGLKGDKHHPKVRAAVADALRRIRAAGHVGGTGGDFDNVAEVIQLGAGIVMVGTKSLLQRGAADYKAQVGSGGPATIG